MTISKTNKTVKKSIKKTIGNTFNFLEELELLNKKYGTNENFIEKYNYYKDLFTNKEVYVDREQTLIYILMSLENIGMGKK